MLERLSGEKGARLRKDMFASQKIVAGDRALAEELASRAVLMEFKAGSRAVEQGGSDNDVYFVLSGSFSIVVNGQEVQRRAAGDTFGEMAAIEPSIKRSASVIALEDAVVGKLDEPALEELASRYPGVWRFFAREMAKRLMQRNDFVNVPRDKVRVFVISSAESLPIAREIQSAFEHDNFQTVLWTDGVFKVSSYAIQSLEDQVDVSDFAIAIAQPEDITTSRGAQWPTARDNVIFELGLFMGRLGRKRAILMESRDDKVKLPSDMAGLTTIGYRYQAGADAASSMAPACHALRKHILALGLKG
jgi:CRP/FNR family cyclic AMP-dependent transcriptional regulator